MPPGAGMGRYAGQMMGKLAEATFSTELFYSFVIIVISLMIYFGTKELYELTSHKGIKYFRRAFLFFAIAYFARIFIKFLVHEGIVELSKQTMYSLIGPLSTTIFVYLSTMAIFYLLYSAFYQKFDKRMTKLYLFHVISIVLAVVIFIFRDPIVYLTINLLLFVFVLIIILVLSIKSKNKKKGSLYTIYVLLFSFWILNILDILIPNALHSYQIYVYIASVGIFLTILYKVLKKSG